MALPKMSVADKKKPLGYDAAKRKFIYYDDIASGREPVIPIEQLSAADLKRLIIERQRSGPDFTVQAISGPPYSRDDVVRAIEEDAPFGREAMEAEAAYLRSLLAQISKQLDR
jgi:hypothetical protein